MRENHPEFKPEPTPNQERQIPPDRGKLKVFLGYASGVGKTYAMLEAAQRLQTEGVDVVAAYVDTHGCQDMDSFLADLEVMPSAQRDLQGHNTAKTDLDAVLARSPEIVLVDDLAHTNPPGSRHRKRCQDIQELLSAGISVYSTLNIQHLESLNDTIFQITNLSVFDTLPDHVLDEADEIEVVDLPVEELLKRVEVGKVYVPESMAQTAEKFFRPGNLTALREIMLRRAAERVDEQMRAYMKANAIVGPWPAGERVLVCVGASPLSERLVRAGRRLAARHAAEWFAVYVETPDHVRLSDAEKDRVLQTLRMAEQLGATATSLSGRSVAEAIISYAQNHNVTKIVAGKPLRSRWVELLRGSIVDQIIRHSQDIDIYVISSQEKEKFSQDPTHVSRRPVDWKQYGLSSLMVALATVLGLPLRAAIEPANLVMFYLAAVVVAAVYLGRNPAILASILSVIAFDFIFVHPYSTFNVTDAEYLLTFAALLAVGVVISTLAAQAREQEKSARQREVQTSALYELSRSLTVAAELNQVADAVVNHIRRTFDSQAAFFIAGEDELELDTISAKFPLLEADWQAARWVFEHNQPAGRGTQTFSDAHGFYLPLKASREEVGVLGVYFSSPAQHLVAEQRRLLESFASQAALALERALLAEKASQAQLLEETEKLHRALLNSISHDLRTPLASITGALSSLRDDAALLDEASRRELVSTAWEETDRLNRLVRNLLDMTRLEAGALKVARQLGDVQDVIGVALTQLAKRLQNRKIEFEIADDLPLVPMDFVLIVQVLVNLIENAVKYSPPRSPLCVRAYRQSEEVIIEIADRGIGVPKQELENVFNKFYRILRPDGVGGTGLGLSISKGIVEAHSGRIWIRNRKKGGTAVAVALPVERAMKQDAEEASRNVSLPEV